MSDTAITPTNGTIGVTGQTPLIAHTIPLPSAGVMALTGYTASPDVHEQTVVTPSYGSIAMTGYAPRLHGWAETAVASTTWVNL